MSKQRLFLSFLILKLCLAQEIQHLGGQLEIRENAQNCANKKLLKLLDHPRPLTGLVSMPGRNYYILQLKPLFNISPSLV